MPASPGRMLRMSAVGETWLGLIPNARSSCGVATYTGPLQLRPDAACWRLALVDSSWITWPEPSAAAMACASAVSACVVPPPGILPPGPAGEGPFGELG